MELIKETDIPEGNFVLPVKPDPMFPLPFINFIFLPVVSLVYVYFPPIFCHFWHNAISEAICNLQVTKCGSKECE